MVGINGVTAFAVARRMPEFGIRIALGAKPGNIVSLVLGWTLRIVAIGVLFGVAAAWLAREAGRAFLMMKISWTDQIVIHVAAICLLMATAVLASLAPAIRAASIAPATAQRR